MLIYAKGTHVIITWPPSGTSGLTTVNGIHGINLGTGNLQVTNNAGGSAYTYVTAMSAAIGDCTIEADGFVTDAARVVGLIGRSTFTATNQDNGYRYDVAQFGTPGLRLFRADATVLTSLTASVPISGYYTIAGNPITHHMKFLGSSISAWMSAVGQSDTATISAIDGTYGTGRVAMLSFLGGGGGINEWTALRVAF